tara:strand:- start:32660 stop:33475 length:816 start_codon:yes stop_codon:yes gene_type:complete
MNVQAEYRYNRLTWEQMNEAITMGKVVVLPTGSTEQHGKHLPLDTDDFLVESVCHELGKRASNKILVLPTISYGLNLHHIDFPGTIHIEPEIFIAFCLNITKSLAYHGFQKILIVNGHGSNSPLVDLVARKTILATKSLCFAANYFTFATKEFNKIKTSKVIAHADEFETSLYLHLAEDRVQMNKALPDNDRSGKYCSSDSTGSVRFNDFWGRWTSLGVHGDPRSATAEKGKIIFEAAVNGLLELVDDIQGWPIEERNDQHTGPTQQEIKW